MAVSRPLHNLPQAPLLLSLCTASPWLLSSQSVRYSFSCSPFSCWPFRAHTPPLTTRSTGSVKPQEITPATAPSRPTSTSSSPSSSPELDPPTGFSNDTVGRNSDRVHGLALCRGDRTEAQCRECLAGAVEGVVKACPYRKGATVWYETCHLRYSDRRFFGSPTGAQFYMWNVKNVSDPASFGQLLTGLMDGLTRSAAHGPPSRMFAVGDVDSTGGGKIYGLAQCTRDLSAEGCNSCLREEISKLPTCCNGKQGGRVMGGSCYLRYEVSPFYNASAAAEQLPPLPVSPAMSPAPPPSAGAASPPASAATVNKAILDLPHLLAFFFFLLVFAWEF